MHEESQEEEDVLDPATAAETTRDVRHLTAGGTPPRTWMGVACIVASAVALVVTSTDFGGLWWLLPIALVPMVVAQYRLLPHRWAPAGVAGVGAAYWGALALLSQGSLAPWWTGVLLAAPAVAVVYLVAWADLRLTQWTRYRFFVVQMPVVWVGLEVLLGLNPVFATNEWLGYRLQPVPELIQPVSVLGTPTLGFLLLALDWAAALLVIALLDRRAARTESGERQASAAGERPRAALRPALVGMGVVLAATVLWCGGSLLILREVRDAMGPTVRVAAVQAGISIYKTPESAWESAIVEPLADYTRQAADQGARLVVWPEDVLPFDPRSEHAAQVAGIARDNGVYLVAPFTVGKQPASPNKALVLGPDGQTLGVYNKVHPVVVEGEGFRQPFLPLAFPADFGTFGVAICFDNHYLDVVPAIVRNGARLIAMPSLIWPGEAKNQLAVVVFRAVENRVAYAKAELGWSSAIVAPDGTVRAVTMPRQEPSWALLVADVPLGPDHSPFTAVGRPLQWVYVAGLAAFAGAFVILAVRRRLARR
jgi:apolipoprotein N-acyltransferase